MYIYISVCVYVCVYINGINEACNKFIPILHAYDRSLERLLCSCYHDIEMTLKDMANKVGKQEIDCSSGHQ